MLFFADDGKNRRRRRRHFPQEVFEFSVNLSSNEEKTKSDNSFTAFRTSLSSPITASSIPTRTSPRKSELSVHMENARKGIAPAFSEMGKTKTTRRVSKEKSNGSTSNPDSSFDREVDIGRNKHLDDCSKTTRRFRNAVSGDEQISKNTKTSRRLDEITALTHATLARVETLVSKSLERKIDVGSSKKLDAKCLDKTKAPPKLRTPLPETKPPSSILKKKSIEEPVLEMPLITHVPIPSGPISILKRKVSSDESRLEGFPSSTQTPVTFSPSVIEPAITNRRQGILKKRRSLDESQVLRHRSCSPDAAVNKFDSRSILKNQRRSSLEEITRNKSPDTGIQGILKRRPSRNEEDFDHSLNSPQSILKRRSGASSAGSSTGTPHVSITTAVILAAAGGAEMVLENEALTTKPILKKNRSEQKDSYDNYSNESLKPILKKKSSTDTDDAEERPKPILKQPKNQDSRESDDSDSRSLHSFRCYQNANNDSGSECDMKSIRKTYTSEEYSRQRLSFSSEGKITSVKENVEIHKKTCNFRRPNTICTDFNFSSITVLDKEEDRDLHKPRPLSVSELAKKFEKSLVSTGAIPKKSSHKRDNDRRRTQPITYNEFEARLVQ